MKNEYNKNVRKKKCQINDNLTNREIEKLNEQ